MGHSSLSWFPLISCHSTETTLIVYLSSCNKLAHNLVARNNINSYYDFYRSAASEWLRWARGSASRGGCGEGLLRRAAPVSS